MISVFYGDPIPLTPLKRGDMNPRVIGISFVLFKVPLFKGDLGGSGTAMKTIGSS
jgi:hypothetical protein